MTPRSANCPTPKADRVVCSTIAIGLRGQLKISPTAQIVDSILSVGSDAKLTVGEGTVIQES